MPQPANEHRLGQPILWCPHCRVQVNAQGTVPGARYACQQCRGELQAAPPPSGPVVRQTWPAPPLPDGSDPKMGDEIRQALADPSRRIDRYAVLSELGRGGMGVVYRCYDPQLNRTVAIKMILESGADAEGLARFQREALAVAKIQHTGIVTLLGTGVHEGCPYLVMDFVAGETFNELLIRKNISPRRIAQIVREVSLALDHAHAAGIIHRDIKPQNIMIDPQGRPLVMDFGLARDTSALQQLTQTGQILGTPAYMSPEQTDATSDQHGPWTDVYALGAVLYRALVGRPVFEASGPAQMLKKVILDEPEPPSRLAPTVPPGLEIITLRCLEKKPQRRYQSAAALADQLELFLDEQAVQPQPNDGLEMGTSGARRNLSMSLSVLAATLVAVSAVAAIAYKNDGHQKDHRNQEAKLEAAGETNDKGPERQNDTTLTRRQQAAAGAEPANTKETGPTSATDWYERGQAQLSAGNKDRAIDDFSHAIRIDPQLAGAWLARGKLHYARGNYSSAAADSTHALEIDPNLAEAWLSRGKSQARRLMVKEAIADLSRAIELDPGNWEAWHLRSRQRTKSGDLDGSAADRDKAVSISPTLQLGRAREFTAQGHYAAAIAAVNRAVELNPDCELDHLDVKPWIHRANERYQQGDIEGALSDFSRAIEIFPSSASGLAGRGVIRREKGEFDGAVADFTRAIEIFPDHGAGWYGRATTRGLAGDLDGAIADFTRAIEIAPNDAKLWNNRSFALMTKGDLDSAMDDINRAIKIAPRFNKAWINRGAIKVTRGDLQGAIADFTRAIEIDPTFANSWEDRGSTRKDAGDLDGAIEDFNCAIEINPTFALALHNRGHAWKGKGNMAAAIADFTRLIELEPGNEVAWQQRADARQAHGDLDGAIADLTRAIEIAPNYGTVWANRGFIRARNGDLDGAIEDLTRAIEIDPNNVDAWNNRGLIRSRKSDLDGASADFTRAIEIDPNYVDAWNNRGFIRSRKGDIDGAIEDLERFLELAPEAALAPTIRIKLQKLRQQRATAPGGANK